jgi:hypothetical protein
MHQAFTDPQKLDALTRVITPMFTDTLPEGRGGNRNRLKLLEAMVIGLRVPVVDGKNKTFKEVADTLGLPSKTVENAYRGGMRLLAIETRIPLTKIVSPKANL